MSERDLPALLTQAWDILAEGVRDARSPARIVAFATVGAEGPEARMIALRAADPDAATLDLHTDAGTAKLREVERDPRGAVLVWHPERQIQLRLRGEVAVHARTDEAREAWAGVPDAQRWNYGAVPSPGDPIREPDAFERREDFDGFALLRLAVREIDVVSLTEPHRRALYRRADTFAGTWLSP